MIIRPILSCSHWWEFVYTRTLSWRHEASNWVNDATSFLSYIWDYLEFLVLIPHCKEEGVLRWLHVTNCRDLHFPVYFFHAFNASLTFKVHSLTSVYSHCRGPGSGQVQGMGLVHNKRQWVWFLSQSRTSVNISVQYIGTSPCPVTCICPCPAPVQCE